MVYNFAAEIIWDEEVRQYIGIVPGLPGAHAQADNMDELHEKLQDVIRLCLEELTDEEIAELPENIEEELEARYQYARNNPLEGESWEVVKSRLLSE
ncbi:type II toxin-antitoxin system HicB family antitoxin [Mariniphaga sp.]|uniref:type II toxin-antitoxin system HicB family antitoxin n=1 Tax=Mariniphaga sp. TaxID=1954475 RepID=UPI003566CBCB